MPQSARAIRATPIKEKTEMRGRRLLTSMFVLVVVLGLAYGGLNLAGAAGPPSNVTGIVTVGNDPSNPVPVQQQGTANVNVTNTSVPVHEQGTANVNVDNFPAIQPVSVSLPTNSFDYSNGPFSDSASPVIANIFSNEPVGTRYAISNVTLAAGPDNAMVTIFVRSFSQTPLGCDGPQLEHEPLVTLTAPANDTASVSFPQPFVSPSNSDTECLTVNITGTAYLTVVGHKFS
jgi:hypothetical protein